MYSVNLKIQTICLCIILINCYGNEYSNTSYTREFRDTTKRHSCVLPPHPTNGEWAVFKGTTQYFPGGRVPSGTILQINCKKDYTSVDEHSSVVCIHGSWSNKIGKCLRTCSPIYNTPVMTVTCSKNKKKLESCDKATDGTIAKFQCADFYEDQSLNRHLVHSCNNGRWSHTRLPECVPKCGQKSTREDPTLIVGGSIVTRGNYPWQAALYDITDKTLLCGGSLLNQRVILTAAHCVTNSEGVLLPKETYMIAVGKYYRKYNDSRDRNEAQFSPIYEIYLPRQYKGEIQNYFGDIAIIVTKKTFKLSLRVQPVCVDWIHKNRKSLEDATELPHGYVTGWGFTVRHKNPSKVLKELEIPLITEKTCNRKIPDDYKRYLTDDKLCAGFLDSGTSVCKGDSGGGLVLKYGNRYYVVAIVSLSPQAATQEGGCDIHQYALYTNVSYYIDNFLLEMEARFRPSLMIGDDDCEDDPKCKKTSLMKTQVSNASRACILPQHPAFGRWEIFENDTSFSPGMEVTLGTILLISCDENYSLKGDSVLFCNINGWSGNSPLCLRSCPPIKNTATTEYTCSCNDEEMMDCSNPVDGTILRHKCAPFYENLQWTQNPLRICQNGSWDLTIPECTPICGVESTNLQPLTGNGNIAKRGEYPWHVAIYRGKTKRFICGGTLISQKLILTAAHCVTNKTGSLQNKTLYSVAVGNYYGEYNNSLNKETQISKLADIFISLQGNIAILVPKKTFILSDRVQPVCVDWTLTYSDDVKTSGYISDWTSTSQNATSADISQDLKIQIIPNEKCLETTSKEFKVYITNKTFCGDSSLCSDDAGGALVTTHDGRFYITGIISTVPSVSKGNCEKNHHIIYTNISAYNNFLFEKDALIKSQLSKKAECRNGDPCQTTAKPPVVTTGKTVTLSDQMGNCILPEHVLSGRWSILGSPSSSSRGMLVTSGTILQIECNKYHKLEGYNAVHCRNGKWSTDIGYCLKVCPPRVSTATMRVTCIYKNKERENCTDAVHGTIAKFKCAPFYEDLALKTKPIHICEDGNWDQPKPNCVPVCGQKTADATQLFIGGSEVKKGDYPWQVALYTKNKKELICGGSLLTQRIILTAAHCVTTVKGGITSKEDYIVAVGKYYRQFNDTRDFNEAQFSELSYMFVPEQYKGETQNYLGDIAILITKKVFVLSRRVLPVCVDYGQNFNPASNDHGYVTGWGFTVENSSSSDVLKELKVPSVTISQCERNLPEDNQLYLTYDKLCAGYSDEGTSICRSDSGSGLVFKHDCRYYVTGIVSHFPTTNVSDCHRQQYALYTNVSTYINQFILPKVGEFHT